MSGSALIVVIAVAIIGVLLIFSFNIAWYRRQKQKNRQLQKSIEFEGIREERPIPKHIGSHTLTNEQHSLKQNQAAGKDAGTPVTNTQYDDTKRELTQDPVQVDQNVQVQPLFNWWLAEHTSDSAIQELVATFNRYGQDPNILGWVAWDEQILCANRHYDEGFLNAVSSYISAVAHLQKELHMKQFLNAKINGSDGDLVLRREKQAWIALVVEDESKLTIL